MEYQVIEGSYIKELEELVASAIEEGWTPLGGVSAYSIVRNSLHGGQEIDTYYAQAMIKEPPVPWNLPLATGATATE